MKSYRAPVFEELAKGMALPSLLKGPMSPAHIMRWSSAIENWHRIHYDRPFAIDHDGLPGIVVNGSWKQHVLIQLVTDWIGENGWLWKLSLKFVGIDLGWDTLTATGTIQDTVECGAFGIVTIGVALVNQHGESGTVGSASAVVRKRQGPEIVYPFDPSMVVPKMPTGSCPQ